MRGQRLREADVVDGRRQIHAHVDVVLGGVALQRVRALLQDAVRAVVEDHVDDGEVFARRRPQRLVRVHRAAVADQRDDRPIRQSELHADRGREAPADAATADAEEALGVGALEERADAVRGRDRFVDDDRVVRRRLRDGVHERQRRDR